MFVISRCLLMALVLGTPHPEGDPKDPAIRTSSTGSSTTGICTRNRSLCASDGQKERPDPAVIVDHQRKLAAGIREAGRRLPRATSLRLPFRKF